MRQHLTTSIRSCAAQQCCNIACFSFLADFFLCLFAAVKRARIRYAYAYALWRQYALHRNKKKEYPVRGLGLHKPHI